MRASTCAVASTAAATEALAGSGAVSSPSFATWSGLQPATAPRITRERNSDKLVPAAAAYGDLSRVGQAADGLQDFLVLRFHLGQFHGATVLQVLAQGLRGALAHVPEDLLAQRRIGTLERDHEVFALDLAQEDLDRLVVQVDQVVEGEHLVLDRLSQVGVLRADGIEQRHVGGAAQEVDDLRRGLAAAEPGALDLLAAGEQERKRLVQLLERVRLDAVEGGDAQDHVGPQLLGKLQQDRQSLVALQVDQDRRDDLRMLAAYELGDGGGVHPAQALDAGHVAALGDPVDQHAGLLLP